MQKQNGVFVMPCKVNGLTLKFIFDTGASDVSISLTEALFMLKNGYLSESDLIGSEYYKLADGKISEGTKIILKKIEIGNLKLLNVKATIVHNLSAPLLLGQSALNRLGKIEFDYSKNILTILGGALNYVSYEKNDDVGDGLSPINNKLQVKLNTFLYSKENGSGNPIVKVPSGSYVEVLNNNTGTDYIKVLYTQYTGYIVKMAFYER